LVFAIEDCSAGRSARPIFEHRIEGLSEAMHRLCRLRDLATAVLVAAVLTAAAAIGMAAPADDDALIAKSLAEMLRAGRNVISSNQARINDPALGDKGLSGQVVLQQAVKIYQASTGTDPASIDPASRHGKLLHAEMDAIVETMDANQATINATGTGFKGFIPAVFGRLVTEAFEKHAQGAAQIKVTAPEYLVRNLKARPNAWENDIIKTKLLAPDWPRGQPYDAVVEANGRQAFRMMMPEYYAASCLSCHGSPKGEVDVTGYPKEGAKEGDLGSVISLTIYK
jgi:hypothetical protein